MPYDVIAVGDVMLDGSLPAPVAGGRVHGRIELRAGGSAANAALAIGVDTGFTHLAAALGTPTIALFTVTDPRRHGVESTGGHGRDLGDIGTIPSVDDVLRAAGERLRLSPRC